MMWQAYKYIYYWLYTWNKGMWGKSDAPEHNAAIGMSLSFVCNIGSIAILIDILTGVMIIPLDLPKIKVLIPLIIIVGGHYLAFVYKGKYRVIEKEFKKESKQERRRKGFWVLLYTFGSMVFFIALGFFGIWIKD